MTAADEKTRVAHAALESVTDGMVLGLGSGSTAEKMIRALGERVAGGLSIRGVPTSKRSQELAVECGIPLVTFDEVDAVDLTIDGADEIDHALNCIKGGGGALLREKIVAFHSKELLIIGDSSKLVDTLGTFPLPVEVSSFAVTPVRRVLERIGGTPRLRMAGPNAYRTDEGHQILDCEFGEIENPIVMSQFLSGIPGVMEHGLFVQMATRALIAQGDEIVTLERVQEGG